jgi:hypothetical protein
MLVSHTSPWVVLPEPGLPPVLLIPVARPAQEARCATDGKRTMSVPISAIRHAAARLPTAVMLSKWSRARAKGMPASLTCVANSASMRASGRPIAANRGRT